MWLGDSPHLHQMTKLTPVARRTVGPMDPCEWCKTAMEVVSSPKNGTLDKQKIVMSSNLGCHISMQWISTLDIEFYVNGACWSWVTYRISLPNRFVVMIGIIIGIPIGIPLVNGIIQIKCLVFSRYSKIFFLLFFTFLLFKLRKVILFNRFYIRSLQIYWHWLESNREEIFLQHFYLAEHSTVNAEGHDSNKIK